MSGKSNYHELYDAIDALEESLARRFPGLASHEVEVDSFVLYWNGKRLIVHRRDEQTSLIEALCDSASSDVCEDDRAGILELAARLPEVVVDLEDQAKAEARKIRRLVKIAKECIR